jgi:hypothetical protein
MFDATPMDTEVGSKSPGVRRFGRLLIQFNSFSSEKERYDCQNEQGSHVLSVAQSFGLTNRYASSKGLRTESALEGEKNLPLTQAQDEAIQSNACTT